MDVHTPHVPDPEILPRYAAVPAPHRKFDAVLDEYDHHMGRLFEFLKASGLEENTIVVFSSDNGPEPSFEHVRSGGLRGMKWSLYEGGIRTPLIVRWTGKAPAGKVDETSVVAGVDFFPTLCALAGVPTPAGTAFDGEDRSGPFLGRPAPRTKPLFWEYGRQADYLKPKAAEDCSPNVALRDGPWKLLLNADGTRLELYNVPEDPKETTNLAQQKPDLAKSLAERALAWRRSLP
jgi:arylsulfatase A-like enzyme